MASATVVRSRPGALSGRGHEVGLFDRKSSSSNESKRPSGRPAEPRGSDLALGFARGEAEAITAVNLVVTKVIKRRGYYIPHDERGDVIQETVLDLVRSVKGRSFEGDEEFQGFARMVAHRRCVDWTRQATRRTRIEPQIKQVVLPDDTLEQRERRALALDVFSKLKKPCRELLALRIGRGLSYAQISELMGRSEGALRTQSYYCLNQARTIFNRIRRRKKLVRISDWRQE
jgi:RNA polymerase sigma factor (sigma-70 family)